MTDPHSPLRLNVGLFLHQSIGYLRDFEFELPTVRFDEDFSVQNLQGVARITRTPQGLLLQVKLGATLSVECVRCLNEFSLPIKNEFSELYAFNRRSVSETGVLLPDDGHIDLYPLAREYLLLAIPISPVCRPACKGLCIECGENLNENTCEHSPISNDPPLPGLKQIRDPDK